VKFNRTNHRKNWKNAYYNYWDRKSRFETEIIIIKTRPILRRDENFKIETRFESRLTLARPNHHRARRVQILNLSLMTCRMRRAGCGERIFFGTQTSIAFITVRFTREYLNVLYMNLLILFKQDGTNLKHVYKRSCKYRHVIRWSLPRLLTIKIWISNNK